MAPALLHIHLSQTNVPNNANENVLYIWNH